MKLTHFQSNELLGRMREQLSISNIQQMSTGCVQDAVVTPGILSRVFLFHFEKISSHYDLFRVFRDVSVNTSRNSRFGLKKRKKNFKTKINLHSIHQKSSKEKKKKRNEQKYMYNKV